MNTKAPAKRVPTSKPRKVATGETMKFTIESNEDLAKIRRRRGSEPLLPKYLASPL